MTRYCAEQHPCRREGNEMAAVLTIGLMFAIWVIVIWGASYFNQNIN
jgi:hypothetical protein